MTSPILQRRNLRHKEVTKELSKLTQGLWPEPPGLMPLILPSALFGSGLSNPLSLCPNPGYLLLAQFLLLTHQGGNALPG